MKKGLYLLLLLVLSNTFSLQHMHFTRALYPHPKHITEEKFIPSNVLKQQAMSDIIENMMELMSMKFRTGKRNADQSGPDLDETIMIVRFIYDIIRSIEGNNSEQRDEKEMKLTELRDNMAKRSFSSLRIRHDG